MLLCSRAQQSPAQRKTSEAKQWQRSAQFLFYPPPLYLLSISHISTKAVFQIQPTATLGSNALDGDRPQIISSVYFPQLKY